MLVLTISSKTPFLDCEDNNETREKPKGPYDICYEEPDLVGGVQGVDYGIAYDTEEPLIEMDQ
jgi:hypothetical protein